MAGSFPDAPDHKIYYNDDGSIVFTQPTTGGVVTVVTDASLNGEFNADVCPMNNTTRIGVVFPQPMDIKGVYCYHNGTNASPGTVSISTDTTDGSNGTWTTPTTSFPTTGVGDPNALTQWRSAVQSVTYNAIQGITLSAPTNNAVRQFHLYGRPSASPSSDRLRFWDPVTDTEVLGSHFDYGDVPHGQADTIQFRVKNNSATKTANSVTVTDDAITPASPTLASQTEFSTDDTTYTPTLPVGDLAPGDVSAVFYARLTLRASAAVGPWRQRFRAAADTWT